METLSALGHLLLTVVTGLVVLTVLVAVHELGHYLFAKKFGMGVNAFAIFMGGVRKTDLRPWLKSSLAPASWVWGLFLAALVAAVVGAFAGSQALYFGGWLVAGVAVPVWTMLRLSALYHVSPGQVIGTWLKAMAVAAVVIAIGTKLQGVDAGMLVGVAVGASVIALILVYYIPVQMRHIDDDKQGLGEITVHQKEKGEVESVPVHFRPIWHTTGRDGTEFSLLLLPLGGFAAIRGMHPKPDHSEMRIEGGFYSKPPWQRLLVLFAGPLFSVLFGLLALFALFAVAGIQVPDNRPVIDYVDEGSPADKAGLQVGDKIVSVDGTPVDSFYDLIVVVKDNWQQQGDERLGVPTEVQYERDGRVSAVTIVPEVDSEPAPIRDENLEFADEKEIQARLGIVHGFKLQPVSIDKAWSEAAARPVVMVVGLWDSFANLFTRPSEAAKGVGGPTAMAQVTSTAVEKGVYYVIFVGAMLSISLGILNLLPIVPLDGGQMVVAFVEMLRSGRRLSIQVQNLLANSGLALLVLLMLAVFAVDLGRNAEANEREQEQATESRE